MHNCRIMIFYFLLLCFVSELHPEYFGKNKVQFEEFKFKELKTEHFRIMYYPEEATAVRDAARMLERWNDRYQKVFERELSKDQPVILYANHPDFQQTNAIGGLIPQGTGGVTEGFFNRMIVPFTGVYEENDHVLGHELVHAFQYEIMKESEIGLASASNVPLWFIEGMAEYLSIGSKSTLTSMWMRDALLFNDLPTIRRVGRDTKYFPYRFGHSIWAFIGEKYGDDIINPLLTSVLASGWQNGFSDILGISMDSLSNEWQNHLRTKYSEDMKRKAHPSEIGRTILSKNPINLSPSISPDGKRAAVFTLKSIFNIDLFLVDLKKGKIIRNLASSESDLHFSATRYINSTGSWSPDSKRFAFVVYKRGNAAIAIVDVEKGGFKEIISPEGMDDIADIAWSPDGSMMAIAGSSGGISDLFTYDMKKNTTRQLTQDRNAELMPSWSPDGKTIVFSTDRDSATDFDSLTFAPLKIGMYNIETGGISLLRVVSWAKHINPQFSPDGRSIFFVSDPDGFSNIYRYSLDSCTYYRVTNAATGVSGLSENSPALSVSSKTGDMLFNVYQNNEYKLHILDSSQTAGTSFSSNENEYQHTVSLSKIDKNESIVDTYLERPSMGLVTGETFLLHKYHPKLKLLYVGQLFAGVSADPFGIGMAGGLSFLFSDMLGNQLLGVGAQLSGSFRDFGGEIFYLNMNRRLNWGVFGNRIPYLSTRTVIDTDTANVNGENVTADRVTFIDEHVYDNSIGSLVALPISQNRRFELSGMYTRESFDYRAEEIKIYNNRVISDITKKIDAPSSLNLFQTSLAYVGDFSEFGFNGPIVGRRFRLSADPTFGSLQYLAVLADFRQYIFMNPFTLAARFYHYGRYFRDSESDKLSMLFLGWETWIRGYEFYSFDLTECSEEDGETRCPEYDRLIGSRIGVVNLELRVPLFGVERYGLIKFPYIPTDLIAFVDGGIAWTGADKPEPKISAHTKDRVPVFSVGGGTRINILGILVLQIYYSYPFQRTDKKGHWGFIFAPAW